MHAARASASACKLLDGRELTLDEATLVIADEQKAVGLAGIMGGADTAIERGSRDIALEVGLVQARRRRRDRASSVDLDRCQPALRAWRRLGRTGAGARAGRDS